MNTKTSRMLNNLCALGFSFDEAVQLRRIEMTLHRWCELECGDSNDYASWSIERDEVTEKPYMVTHPHTENKSRRRPIADRETGALKRLDAIMKKHPDFVRFYQTDCRGCALYIVRKLDLPDLKQIDSLYTRGFAVTA